MNKLEHISAKKICYSGSKNYLGRNRILFTNMTGIEECSGPSGHKGFAEGAKERASSRHR
jgi:hypothetical protein